MLLLVQVLLVIFKHLKQSIYILIVIPFIKIIYYGKKILQRLAHLYFFIIFNFIYKFVHTFQYNFILVLTFDGSDSGSSSAAFFLASSIIEPQSSTNLIASFFPLKMLLKLENAFFFVFQIYFKFLFFQISTKFFLLMSCFLQ